MASLSHLQGDGPVALVISYISCPYLPNDTTGRLHNHSTSVASPGSHPQGDGPVALVIAPTRELVAQIAKEAKAFAKPLGLNALAVFGGSGGCTCTCRAV